MALESTFRSLFIQVEKLSDMLNAVLLTVGDKPPQRGAALADALENSLLDLLGHLQESRTEAQKAQKAVGHPMDLDRARRALAKCQEHFHHVQQQFSSELVSYEKLKDLAGLGSTRGGEWIHWANSMKHGIEECRGPMEEAAQAVTACWQELAERVGTTNISVSATNIGQKIVARTPQMDEVLGQRVP